MKKSLKRLFIDSATKFLYISVFEDDKCLGKFYEEGKNDHSVKLMINIEKILKENNLAVSDLDQIVVGIGPGSYTGLRIGVVVAKMFGWNNNIDVYTVSSLALIASSSNKETLLLSEIDARRGNSFLGLYKQKDKRLTLVEEEKLTNLEEYKNNISDDFEVVSNGEPNFLKVIDSNLITKVLDIHSLNPNYLRKTEAERNLG